MTGMYEKNTRISGEKVALVKVERERGFLYYINRNGDIARCPGAKGKQTLETKKK